MVARDEVLESARRSEAFFETLPFTPRPRVDFSTVRGAQFLEPLFEFSGACAGCGETPYVKLVSQLFGDRLLVANATGCSSIYGGSLPTTPWTVNAEGSGPAWSNSLFEDNAEFGLGLRAGADHHHAHACAALRRMQAAIGDDLVEALLSARQRTEAEVRDQRERVERNDLALQAIGYGHVYVARVGMGANPQQTLLAMREAEAFPGPSIVLAYSHCIAHGINMQLGLDQQRRAVHSGYWPLIRYNPGLREHGENPLVLDSTDPTIKLREFTDNELRFRILARTDPATAERLLAQAEKSNAQRVWLYEQLAALRERE